MYSASPAARKALRNPSSPIISCNWKALRCQLLLQWNHLSARELDRAGADRRRIALLIEREYGVDCGMVENYLKNFERTMPLAA